MSVRIYIGICNLNHHFINSGCRNRNKNIYSSNRCRLRKKPSKDSNSNNNCSIYSLRISNIKRVLKCLLKVITYCFRPRAPIFQATSPKKSHSRLSRLVRRHKGSKVKSTVSWIMQIKFLSIILVGLFIKILAFFQVSISMMTKRQINQPIVSIEKSKNMFQ